MVLNLLNNAIKFTARGVSLRAQLLTPAMTEAHTERPSRCVIEVEDSGIGIAAEHHERLFRLFS